MCPPAFYGIEYEINPGMNRSRPSRYLLAQEQYCGGEKCNHESRLPSNQQPVAGAGIFGLRIPLSEFIKTGGRAKCLVLHVPYGQSSSNVSYSKLLRSISQIY